MNCYSAVSSPLTPLSCGCSSQLLSKPKFSGVEKIKTIGSTYMAASGVSPESNTNGYTKCKVPYVIIKVLYCTPTLPYSPILPYTPTLADTLTLAHTPKLPIILHPNITSKP